jgi:hypothetical protein
MGSVMELTDEARAEIKDAIRILREDGVHIHKTYPAFLKSQEETPPTDPPTDPTPTEGGPPPVKETKTEKPEKQGLWWKGRTSD